MRSVRGFLLIFCLMLGVLLCLLTMALLSQQLLGRGSAKKLQDLVQARCLAEAGLENVRMKLDKDLRFPPHLAPECPVFSYSQACYDVDDQVIGFYKVEIDYRLTAPPYGLLKIRSEGLLGEAFQPRARCCLRAELDASPWDRSNASNPNPDLYKTLNCVEEP
ncbi:MAG: hypothetical protein U0931_35740 [Vulcanimicrobiota bacterium]